MATLESLWNELLVRQPALDPGYAPKLVQRAWRDIRDSRPWSFLIGNGVLFSPGSITAGAVAVTQFSATVTFNATAIAALDGITNPIISLRQFRAGGPGGGPIYDIASVDAGFAANGIATLNRPFLEATNAAASYAVYRCYYGPPMVDSDTEVTDFLRYRSIYNPATLQRFRLYGSTEELTMMDPKRVTSGNPWALFTHSLSTGKFYEMYPHPTASQSYIAVYQKRGTDLASGEQLPEVITEELILEKAMYHTCLWATSAVGRIATLKGTNWQSLAIAHNANYMERLREVALRDEDTLKQNGIWDDYLVPFNGWPFTYSPTMPNGQIAIW